MDLTLLSMKPLFLKKNRVWRPFKGGALIDEWQHIEPRDSQMSEEWIGSVVEARNPNSEEAEGLSWIDLDNGKDMLLRDLIEHDPELFLGKHHVDQFGSNPNVLVKVLDSYTRLMIQVHPSREYAKQMLNSEFGKTEAWYILGGREIDGELPYVLLGFKPGITREIWMDLFKRQDIKGMEEALHKFLVKPGDIYYVQAGIPHAAGSGVFFLEIQEPSDLTIRTEAISPSGVQMKDAQMHLGLGFEQMFDCFLYESCSPEEILDRCLITPKLIRDELGGKWYEILNAPLSPYFGLSKLEVFDSIETVSDTFSFIVVIKGSGKLVWEEGEVQIKQADTLFLPSQLTKLTWMNTGEYQLEVVVCNPPQ